MGVYIGIPMHGGEGEYKAKFTVRPWYLRKEDLRITAGPWLHEEHTRLLSSGPRYWTTLQWIR